MNIRDRIEDTAKTQASLTEKAKEDADATLHELVELITPVDGLKTSEGTARTVVERDVIDVTHNLKIPKYKIGIEASSGRRKTELFRIVVVSDPHCGAEDFDLLVGYIDDNRKTPVLQSQIVWGDAAGIEDSVDSRSEYDYHVSGQSGTPEEAAEATAEVLIPIADSDQDKLM